MSVVHNPYMTLTFMALVVYLMRSSGYWLAGRVVMSPLVKAWLGYIPACLMVSIVIPLLLAGTFVEWFGAAMTIVMVGLTRSVLSAMLSGMATVFFCRLFFG